VNISQLKLRIIIIIVIRDKQTPGVWTSEFQLVKT